MALVSDAPREGLHHDWICDVLLLRGRGHHEVVLDQPGDELDVLACETVVATELARINRPQR